jgi:hypothetical protein
MNEHNDLINLFECMGIDTSKPAALVAALNGDIENALAASTPNGIEKQEKAGQLELCKTSNKLPKDMHFCNKEDFEKLGIKFLEDIDKLFVKVELPIGWSIKPAEPYSESARANNMWSDLVDNNGAIRAQIFYKAAFYDKKATIHAPNTRFHIECEYVDNSVDNERCYVIDRQNKSAIFETAVFSGDEKSYENECKEYLNAHYPEWQDFTKYWEK